MSNSKLQAEAEAITEAETEAKPEAAAVLPCGNEGEEDGNLVEPKEEEKEEVEDEEEPDGQYAECMLPEEMWTMIFGQIGDKKLLWTISQTCHHFKDMILSPSKNVWLFSEVLPLLADYIDGKDVIKCRTICPGWRDDVDAYFENHPSLTPYDAKNNPRRSWLTPMEEKGIGLYTFRGKIEGSVFQKMFDHPKNPFLGRSLAVRLSKVNRNVAMSFECQHTSSKYAEHLDTLEALFCGELEVLLEKLGEHVWHLEMRIGYDLYQLNMLARVAVNRFICRKLLTLVPNLRTLRISGCLQKDGDKESLDLMCGGMELPPLPHLVKLELHSSTYGFYSDPTAIMKVETELLEKYHSQLKSLRMPDPRRFGWNRFPDLKFSNLTELDIGNVACLYRTVESHMEMFLKIKAPKLKKLAIDMTALKPSDIQHLLNALNQIPRSMPYLNALRLEVGYLLPFEDEVRRWLRPREYGYESLPRYFTTLEICDNSRIGFRRFCNVALKRTQFLHLFDRVQNMTYQTGRAPIGSPAPTSEECKIILPEIEAYKLDLWTELRHLKILSCENTVYTRARYGCFAEKTETPKEAEKPGESSRKFSAHKYWRIIRKDGLETEIIIQIREQPFRRPGPDRFKPN